MSQFSLFFPKELSLSITLFLLHGELDNYPQTASGLMLDRARGKKIKLFQTQNIIIIVFIT